MIFNVPPALRVASFYQETTLDGTSYRLTFRWNERESEWYMTVADIEGVVIAGSRKLVAGSALLRYITDYTVRPPGEFIVVGIMDRDNFDIDAFLTYSDEDELAS